MAQGKRPLAIETPGIGATRRHVMGDPLKGGHVRRVLIET